MDILTDLRTFARVAEKGSFSAVAREAGSTQPAISRQIAALEEFYGVRLFHRSTRKLALTEEGRAFQPHAAAVLAALDAAREALQPALGDVSGVVRIGTTVALGIALGTRVCKLLERHKRLAVDIVLGEGHRDMIDEGLDLLISGGTLPDSSFVARQIGINRPLLVASPVYLQRAGEPLTPGDLDDHECVSYPVDGDASVWHFTGPNGGEEVVIRSRIRANSSEVIRRAVMAGAGIGLLPRVIVREALEAGRLKLVLPDYVPTSYPIQILYPSRRNLPARTRAVIDFLVEELALDPMLAST